MLTHVRPSEFQFTDDAAPQRISPALCPTPSPRSTQCPEPLRTPRVLPSVSRGLAARQRTLLRLHRYYELMRQSETLRLPPVSPRSAGLRRLLPAPAGSRTFPTLSLRIFPCVLGPLPRLPSWCSCPFLPTRQRPSRPFDAVGARQCSVPSRLRYGCQFRGCNHSLTFRPAGLLATQIAPTAAPLDAGQP